MKEKTPSYVKIDPPLDLRRAILEGIKSDIHTLQRFEKIQELRHQREQRIQDLMMLEKVIASLVEKARAKLPAVSSPKLNAEARETVPAIVALAKKPGSAGKTKVSKKAVQQAKKASAPAPLSLNELEKQLKNIDEKLGKMG